MQEISHAAELCKRRRGDEDVDEEDQHHELEHVRVDDAKKAGRRRIDDEHQARDDRACFIGNADLVSEHVDDGRRCRDLRRNRSHHRKGDERAEHDLRAFSEALLKKVGNGRDIERRTDGGNSSRKAREDEHAKKIRQRRHNGLEAARVRNARAPHEAASADDRRADRRHQDKRPERAPAEIIVVHVPHLANDDKSDEHHRNEVSCDDEKVDGVNLIMYHVKSPFFACRMVSVNTHPLFRRCPPDAASAFGEKLHNAPARGQISHEDHKVSAPQSRIRPRRYDLLSASADGDNGRARRAPEFELAKALSRAVPVLRNADTVIGKALRRLRGEDHLI